jgi:hypothetical protein
LTQQNQLLASAIEAIGNTPLVELSRMTAGVDGRILAKAVMMCDSGLKYLSTDLWA